MRRIEYIPTEIDERSVEAAIQGVVERLARWRPEPRSTIAAAVREQIRGPAYHDPIRRALVGRDGSVWLLRQAPDRGAGHWIVLDAAGREAFHTRTPPGFALMEADERVAWGVLSAAERETTTRSVVRFRAGCPG